MRRISVDYDEGMKEACKGWRQPNLHFYKTLCNRCNLKANSRRPAFGTRGFYFFFENTNRSCTSGTTTVQSENWFMGKEIHKTCEIVRILQMKLLPLITQSTVKWICIPCNATGTVFYDSLCSNVQTYYHIFS